MAGEEEYFKTCAECGATIYPEHLEKHVAEQWEGKFLCPHCSRDKRSASAAGTAAAATQPARDEPVALVDLEGAETGSLAEEPIAYDKKPTAIRSIGGGPGGMAVGEVSARDLRRATLKGSQNATRARTFHCKLADGALAYMSEQINEWADSSDDIEIKFATSCIGVVEGKHVDPHLIVTVFY